MKPKVVTWFSVYAIILCFLYAMVAVLGIVFIAMDAETLEMRPLEALLIGAVFLVMGLFFLAACALPFFFSPRPWLWVYNLVIICLGMTSACLLPACIPLLIFWLKPETKEYYGRS